MPKTCTFITEMNITYEDTQKSYASIIAHYISAFASIQRWIFCSLVKK